MYLLGCMWGRVGSGKWEVGSREDRGEVQYIVAGPWRDDLFTGVGALGESCCVRRKCWFVCMFGVGEFTRVVRAVRTRLDACSGKVGLRDAVYGK